MYCNVCWCRTLYGREQQSCYHCRLCRKSDVRPPVGNGTFPYYQVNALHSVQPHCTTCRRSAKRLESKDNANSWRYCKRGFLNCLQLF